MHNEAQAMFSYQNASRVAHDFLSRIQDVCDKHEIVGSLRRQRDSVNDIDIMVIPKFGEPINQTLFGDPVLPNLLDERLNKLLADSLLTFELDGPKLKRMHLRARPKAIPLDMFIATPETWPTLLLIRTGSRMHNIKLAKRAQDLHMTLKADGTGLLMPSGTPIRVKDEIDIFRELKVPFRLPQERE